MLDVIGIGSSVYDTLMSVEEYPREDTKAQGMETLIQGGGPCATALVAMAKLGVSAGYMGTIGDDVFGRYMLEDMNRYGVSTSYVRSVPACVSFHAVVLLSKKTASRTCVWNRGTVPPPKPAELDLEVLQSAKVLHLDGHMLEAAIHAARVARMAGVKVSYDAGGTYPGVEGLLPYVDFLIPSEEYALKITGARKAEEAARQLFDAYQPEVVVITQGKRGGILYQEGKLSRYEAFPVDVLDSNGAGDTFHGAFVAGYLKGLSFEKSAVYASAVSALKCTHFGVRGGIPTDEQTRRFLAEKGISLSGDERH